MFLLTVLYILRNVINQHSKSTFYNHIHKWRFWREQYLYSRGGEIRDLKLHTDWWFAFFVFSFYAGKPKMSSHQVLFTPLRQIDTHTHRHMGAFVCITIKKSVCSYRERLDGPNNLTVLRHPLHTAHGGLELGRVSIGRDRNVNLHIVGGGTSLKLRLSLKKPRTSVFERQCFWARIETIVRCLSSHFDHVLDSAVWMFLNHRLDPDQRLHLFTHDNKITQLEAETKSSIERFWCVLKTFMCLKFRDTHMRV